MTAEKNTAGDSILIVEADEGLCRLEAECLARLGEIITAAGPEQALETVRKRRVSLMVLHYSLGETTALELAAKMAEGPGTPPFIITTGRGDERLAVESMKRGASDYLVKDAAFLDNLLPAANRALRQAELQRDLRRSREEVSRNLRLYTFLAQINQAAIKHRDRAALLQAVCDAAVRDGGMRLAWVGRADRDTGRLLPLYHAGMDDGYLAGIRITLEEGPKGDGPSGKAVRSGNISVCHDIKRDPRFAPWREAALERGYRSSAAIPLGTGEDAGLMLNLYAAEKGFFDERELKLLEEIRGDITLSLEAMRAEGARAEAQAALSRTAAQLSHVLDTTKVLLFRLEFSAAGPAMTWITGDAEGLTGYEPAETLKPGWFSGVLHPEDRGAALPAAGEVGPEGRNRDFRIIRKDGSVAWLHEHLRPDPAAPDRVLLGSWTDVTELWHARGRLESLARINAYRPKDEQDLLDYALEEALKLTGSAYGYIYLYSAEKKELKLSAWSKGVLRDCEAREPKTVCRLDAAGFWGEAVRQRKPMVVNDYSAPGPLKRGLPAGHAHIKNFMTVPVFSGDRIVAVAGAANKPGNYTDGDVRQLCLLMESVWTMTENRRAAAAIAGGERRFQELIDAAPYGAAVRRGDKVLYMNRSGLDLLRAASEKDVLGSNILERVQPEYAQALAGRMREVDEEGRQTPPMEIEYKALDGSALELEVHGRPIVFAGEKCAVVFFRDISDRRRADRLLREMADAQRVESLGQLAGGIAHDFNNMLTGVMANLTLLQRRCGGVPGAEEIFSETLGAAESAKALTANLLSFARGGRPVKKEFCLQKALEDMFSLATRGTGAAVDLDLTADLWSVNGDEAQLRQAVNNLLINALQAMPSGGKLRLSARNAGEEEAPPAFLPRGRYVRLEVSDTGVGIPKEYLSHIFEPYFSTKSKGHGLGLSMVWSVVKNHGGHVEAASSPGKGTTFALWLPATGRRLKAPDGERPRELARGSGRVLALEDEEVVSGALRRMLAELGYEAEVVADGRELLEAYAREKKAGRPFDAVIMDLTIPGGMGGRDTVAELRKTDPGARVIVSSGYSDDAAMGDYRKSGFDAVLPKPYRFEDLSEALAALLGGRR